MIVLLYVDGDNEVDLFDGGERESGVVIILSRFHMFHELFLQIHVLAIKINVSQFATKAFVYTLLRHLTLVNSLCIEREIFRTPIHTCFLWTMSFKCILCNYLYRDIRQDGG